MIENETRLAKVDAEEIARIERLYYLPGESVKAHGVHAETARANGLGDEPLRIARTIVEDMPRGDSLDVRPDAGPNAAYRVSYEFEGKPGRHSALGFEDPRGVEHLYGAFLETEGRLWLVPIDSKTLTDAEGPAIEIKGASGRFLREQMGEDPMKTIREELGRSVSEGEYTFHPTDEGKGHRVVELAGIPWWGGSAGPAFENAAREKVSHALSAETMLEFEKNLGFEIVENESFMRLSGATRRAGGRLVEVEHGIHDYDVVKDGMHIGWLDRNGGLARLTLGREAPEGMADAVRADVGRPMGPLALSLVEGMGR